jgi:hypothetical protein
MWPEFKRARDLAFKELPLSEAMIKQLAKKHGIGKKAGRSIIFSPDHVKELVEALPCPSHSSVANGRPAGSSAARSAEFELRKVRELLRPGRKKHPQRSPKKSKRSAKPKSSPSPSTVVVPLRPLLAQR